MHSISIFIIRYVLVDDWDQPIGIKLLAGKAGSKPVFT